MSTAQAVKYALAWQIAAFALLGMQMLLVCVLGWPALALGVTGLLLLFAYRPLAGATVFLQVLLYQNWFLCLFSGAGIDRVSFQMVQGLAFAAVFGLAGIAAVRLLRSGERSAPAAMLTRWVGVALAIAVAYTVYGAMKSSPASSMTYFRNTSSMLLALLIGLDLGRSWRYQTFATIFLVSVAIGLVIAGAELFFPTEYYENMSAVAFWNMKYSPTGGPNVAQSVNDLIQARIVTWFNITGGASRYISLRIAGPNLHPVSYAYVIATSGIVGATIGRPAIVAAALLLLFMAGIKGPLLMLAMASAVFALWWLTRRRGLVLAGATTLLIAYVGAGLKIGLASGDFHVIGLLGGLHGFLAMPQGHGIGVGGNLSAVAGQGLDWASWQKLGVDFALESAVGVLLYQMGVAAAAVYLPVIALVRHGLARRGPRRRPTPVLTDALFIGIVATLANGVFQEEAYSPYALGLLTLLGGIAVSNGVALSRFRRRRPAPQ